MTWRVVTGDCVEAMAAMPDASVDSVCTDPPYGLSFMSKAWDRYSALEFEQWCESWAREALRVLKPGGHLLAFGGTRTYHRLAAGVEDAGFEIRDTISWLYGSGFPKSLNVGKAIDARYRGSDAANDNGATLTAPATDEAKTWEGWGTALKPAFEPVVVARKPLAGTVAGNALAHGTGALNIAATRVSTSPDGEGRWPANVVLSHSPGCRQVGTRKVKGAQGVRGGSVYANGEGFANSLGEVGQSVGYTDADGTETVAAWECVEGCPVWLLDQQTGDRPTGAVSPYTRSSSPMFPVGHEMTYEKEADSGGASRFFLTVRSGPCCTLCGCESAPTAAPATSPSASQAGTAADRAPAPQPQPPEASSQPKTVSAGPAASSSSTTPATDPATTAPPSAAHEDGERIAHLARSAGLLCETCTTATAQGVAELLTNPSQASLAGPASTLALRQRTLSRSLAPVAAGWRSTGITPTTDSLSALCGSAAAATPASTPDDAEGNGHAPSDPRSTSRLLYQSKASSAERNAGLDGFEERERRTLATDRAPGPASPNGQTAVPARNVHPTVKPIELMRWLVRLVTPPGGTVLDPFTGSGTTGIACVLERLNFVGIEREAEYAAIAEARIGWWEQHPEGVELVKALEADKARRQVADTGQLGIFDDGEAA